MDCHWDRPGSVHLRLSILVASPFANLESAIMEKVSPVRRTQMVGLATDSSCGYLARNFRVLYDLEYKLVDDFQCIQN